MANTIIELNDTPSSYSLSANKFLRVNSDGNAVQFWDIKLDYLEDVEASNAYAPSVGQSLVYTADGKWRPSTLDIYSAGNGLNKSALTLNVTAGAGGGLVSNTSGVFISDIANVSGTYGNATHVPAVTVNSKGQVTSVTPTLITASQATTITNSFVGNVVGTSGQISVTGGTGNNSNATLNLVATGVTAATYGNATTIPQITVDTYGRIQNIDQIALVGGGSGGSGNVNTAFKHIAVSGQTNISADKSEDTLTLVGAGGISLTTDAGTDTLTITGNSSAIVGASGINTLSDIDTTGVTNGQSLVYNSSTSKFEAGTPVATLANSGVTAGTYGSSTSSARIVVDAKGIITGVSEQAIPQGDITEVIAGSGLNGGGTTGSVTLNMENTGVTAKTYGNSTYTPVITVNSRGQITNISNIATSGGGGGGGAAQSLTWNAGTYSLGISSGNNVDLSTLNNVVNDTTPQLGGSLDVNGQSIVSVSNGNIPITPNGSGKIILDGLSWPTADGTANYVLQTDGAGQLSWVAQTGSYDNTSVDAHLNVSGASASQVLSWNGSDYAWVAQTDTDAQDLTISGNVISLTGQSGNVDLTSALASVTSSYGDSNVSAYLSAQGYATQSTIVAAITDSAPGTLDTLNELAAALGDDPNFATTITNSIATKANTSSLANVATSGLYTDLTSRPTIALSGSDLTYDGTTLDLTGVGAVGPQGNTGATGATGVSVTNATLNTNDLIITLSNATTINAGNVRGPVGPAGTNGTNGTNGTDGTDGVSITNTALVGSNLVITLSNSSTIDAGNVRGPVGPQGIQGETGPTGATGPAGADSNVAGPQGPAGTDANVTSVVAGTGLTGGGSTGAVTLDVTGGDGITANANDIAVDSTVVRTSGTQTIAGSKTFSDFMLFPNNKGIKITSDAGAPYTTEITDSSFVGTGSNIAIHSFEQLGSGGWVTLSGESGTGGVKINSITYPSSDGTNGQVLTTNGSGVLSWTNKTTDTDTDAQALSLSGNVISLTGQSGNVDLTSLLAGAGGGSGDITSVVAGTGLSGGATTGDATLNLADTAVTAGTYGNATTVGAFTVDAQGRITGVSNVAISGGGGATTLDGLTDVSASSPSSGQVLKWNGSAWAPAADLNSGGGGGGATIQRFKLNYNSSGQLDSTSNLTSLINSISIDSASGGDVTVNFDSSITMPPASVMMYGYDYTNNKYSMVPAETTMALREIAGGGSSGSPTLFDGGSTIALKLRLRETETGASRTFGSVTHAWIQFVIYD